MLKHQGAPRQASRAFRRKVRVFPTGGPRESVPTPMHSGISSGPCYVRLWLTARNAFVHRSVLVPHPVIIVGVPRPYLLDPRPHAGPAANAPDANPRLAAELEIAMRQGNLALGVPYVLRGEDFAPYAFPEIRDHVGLGGCSVVLRGSGLNFLVPLLVHPTLEVGALILGHDGLDPLLRPCHGRGNLLVVVGGGDLLRYLTLGKPFVRGEYPLALPILLCQDPILEAGRGEDVLNLPIVESEMFLELIDVLPLGENNCDGWLLGIRVRGVLLGLNGYMISCQQDQDRHQREKPKRCSPATPVSDSRQTPSRSEQYGRPHGDPLQAGVLEPGTSIMLLYAQMLPAHDPDVNVSPCAWLKGHAHGEQSEFQLCS